MGLSYEKYTKKNDKTKTHYYEVIYKGRDPLTGKLIKTKRVSEFYTYNIDNIPKKDFNVNKGMYLKHNDRERARMNERKNSFNYSNNRHNAYEGMDPHQITFIGFFESLVLQLEKDTTNLNQDGTPLATKGNHGNWYSTFKHLKDFDKQSLPLRNIDRNYCEGFKTYLTRDAPRRNNTNMRLSQNSQYTYFNKFKAAIKTALDKGYLDTNPLLGVDNFKQDFPDRVYLTVEELKKLFHSDYPFKKAFLFSCFTGLRSADIVKLNWDNIVDTDNGLELKIIVGKTGKLFTQALTSNAISLFGNRGEESERVFPNYNYSAWMLKKLDDWVKDTLGYNKKGVKFHSGRHTFAVMMLNNDVDIYTVKELLGHKELKNTEVYAKLLGITKRKAMQKQPDLTQ